MTKTFCMIGKAAADARYLNNDTLPEHGGRGIKSLGASSGDRTGKYSFHSIKMAGRAKNGRQT